MLLVPKWKGQCKWPLMSWSLLVIFIAHFDFSFSSSTNMLCMAKTLSNANLGFYSECQSVTQYVSQCHWETYCLLHASKHVRDSQGINVISRLSGCIFYFTKMQTDTWYTWSTGDCFKMALFLHIWLKVFTVMLIFSTTIQLRVWCCFYTTVRWTRNLYQITDISDGQIFFLFLCHQWK